MTSMIKAVLFDVDGVLVNTESAYYAVFKRVIKNAIGLLLTKTEYKKCFEGRTTKEGFNTYFLEKNITKVNPQELITEIRQQSSEEFSKHVDYNEDVIKTLMKFLPSSIKVGIVSSATRAKIDLLLKNKLNKYKGIGVIVSNEDYSSGKPSPQPYKIAAKKLDVKPSECLVIEDSKSGIQSAKSAEMICVRYASSKQNSLLGADYVFNNLDINKVMEIITSKSY